jgi:hypothetical protein
MEIYFDISLPAHIKRELAHTSEFEFGDEWEEKDYNYRLNICDTVIYAVIDNKIIGHLGLRDNTIKALAVDSEHNSKGVSYELYEMAFQVYKNVYSDDAREPAATHMWERLMNKHPERIRYLSKLDQYEYNEDGF